MSMPGRAIVVAAAIVLAAACSSLPRFPVVSPEGRTTLDCLEYFERLASLPVERQNAEYLAAKAAFEIYPSDDNRLRLALALSLPQTPWHDDPQVVALLRPFGKTKGTGSLAQFAALIEQVAAERMRLREEQRRRDGALREERRRVEELEQKLEALRAIDREMRQRAVPR